MKREPRQNEEGGTWGLGTLGTLLVLGGSSLVLGGVRARFGPTRGSLTQSCLGRTTGRTASGGGGCSLFLPSVSGGALGRVTTCVIGVPPVDGKVLVGRQRDHGGQRQLREGVGRDVADRGVGEELHDHAHVVRERGEHHRGLEQREQIS